MRRFTQVDVFSDRLCQGNPVAVVMDSEGLDDATMQRFAQWTNLSETTFVLPPTQPGADYRLRIFTPADELSFGGHPTVGSAHAWLESGGEPADPDHLVQECGVGPVRLRRRPVGPDGEVEVEFCAPPLLRTGPLEPDLLQRVCDALGLGTDDVVDHQWVDNGPGSVALLLKDPGAVLAVRADGSRLGRQKVGVAARYPNPEPGDPQLEVRFFAPGLGVQEDPVTGSLNAGLGQWLTAAGHMPDEYVAAQGQLRDRRGRIRVRREGDDVWVGGRATTVVRGEVTL